MGFTVVDVYINTKRTNEVIGCRALKNILKNYSKPRIEVSSSSFLSDAQRTKQSHNDLDLSNFFLKTNLVSPYPFVNSTKEPMP